MGMFEHTVADFSYSIYNHLAHSTLFYVVLFLFFLWLYARMTVGMCNSDQDMTGKTVLITGATSGIGKATAFDLARRNARVLLACRDLEMAAEVAKEIVSSTGNSNVVIKQLDLSSFDSVRKCAKDVLRTENELHVLINNAGMTGNEVQITKDGCERIMQTNHLGHFLLSLLLLDLLKRSAPSRIINVSSLGHLIGILNPEDMNGAKESFWRCFFWNLYTRSKLANILFTKELSARLYGTGVTVNSVHPGFVKTEFFNNKLDFVALLFQLTMHIFAKSAAEGAQTSIYLAVHPEVERTTGKFFYDCKESILFGRDGDRQVAKRLFQVSEEIVGTTYQDVSKIS